MKPISVMNVRKFVEVATDAYVRGDDYRPHPPVMKKVGSIGYEPPEDYLDQLWGRCLTQGEADLYRALIEQLVDALKSGDLPSHKPPLMVLNPAGAVNLDGDYVYLDEFRKWSEKNRLNYPKNWHALVMAATEPQGEPVRIEGIAQPVQLREQRIGARKVPTPEQMTRFNKQVAVNWDASKNKVMIAFSKWLYEQEGGDRITPKTLGTYFSVNFRDHVLTPTDLCKQIWADKGMMENNNDGK